MKTQTQQQRDEWVKSPIVKRDNKGNGILHELLENGTWYVLERIKEGTYRVIGVL